MRALVIGGSGFVGRRVVRKLLNGGYVVSVLHRGVTFPSPPDGVREIRADRDRLEEVRGDIERLAPDVVLDSICYTEGQARELANILRNSGVHLVVVSSGDVYRNYDGLRGHATAAPDPLPLAEDAPLRETRYPYRGVGLGFQYAEDYEKILVEETYLKTEGLLASIARLPAVFGPGDPQQRIQQYLQRMQSGAGPILLQDEQLKWRWSRGYVENVAEAICLLLTHTVSSGEVYNIGDEPVVTEEEWVQRIAEIAGVNVEVRGAPPEHVPNEYSVGLDWRYELWMNTDKIRQELGYEQPVSLCEGIRLSLQQDTPITDLP